MSENWFFVIILGWWLTQLAVPWDGPRNNYK